MMYRYMCACQCQACSHYYNHMCTIQLCLSMSAYNHLSLRDIHQYL